MVLGPAIRAALPSDLPAIARIYDHYVVNSHVTFDLEPRSEQARESWFAGFSPSGPHRIVVVEDDSGVAGWASSHPFRPKAAYASSVEVSVYLHPDRTGRGLGTRLYSALLELLVHEPSVHRAYGGVALPNPASVALHEALGFRHVGRFRQVGYKFARYWDVSWYERDLSGDGAPRSVPPTKQGESP